MGKLIWDKVSERFFETGVDHCALYPYNVVSNEYKPGVAWNGITSISESPDGAEPNDQYADNIKYFTLRSAEELNGTIEAFYYPDEWNQCDGNVEVAEGETVAPYSR